MKRLICCTMVLVVLLLTGCTPEPSITGVWEQELEISVLGTEQSGIVKSTARFTFREDGTGMQEILIPDSSHPDNGQEFSYTLEKETLTLNYGENRQERFSVTLGKDSLKLENQRGTYDLTPTAK